MLTSVQDSHLFILCFFMFKIEPTSPGQPQKLHFYYYSILLLKRVKQIPFIVGCPHSPVPHRVYPPSNISGGWPHEGNDLSHISPSSLAYHYIFLRQCPHGLGASMLRASLNYAQPSEKTAYSDQQGRGPVGSSITNGVAHVKVILLLLVENNPFPTPPQPYLSSYFNPFTIFPQHTMTYFTT